jgi:TPR repeat protein
MYKHGQGTEKDIDSAIKWYKKATERDHSNASYILGVIYYYGLDVEKDYSKAIEYYKTAADQGNSNAQYQLGYMYQSGQGTEINDILAIYWYKKVTAKNHIPANYYLETILKNSQDTIEDKEKAAAHSKMAVYYGSENAQKSLKKTTGVLGKIKGFYHR